ncbi:protein EARLY-RESPONSIVE TO DEHYDRATION 7, chloroplastic [Lactuca sativa]|uniref:Senescence domain-containing protein n=1 Tax=Lactuca sativa TaxID=4236 RepID=A0A9R1XN23_LACSA|nr:protein EARLY-RESPONSIVE TO DEHYDRATION 7, chloroplastic [Lactuca sativa]KAJ0213437.1 hypothetical protein LSAT_V11C400213230 [Lactuca sativa]
MASENPNSTPKSPRTLMCPKIDPSAPPLPSSSNPNQPSSSSSSSSLHPNADTNDASDNLFPDSGPNSPHDPSESLEEVIVSVPGAILHLIDKNHSVQLAMGDFSIVKLRQSDSLIAILARVGEEIQWPLARHEACVKLDQSHYFFSLRAPKEKEHDAMMLNYGLTFASKGQEKLLKEMDELLEHCSSFSVQKVEEKKGALDLTMAERMSPSDLKMDANKEEMEQICRAYWTTLAPNVEDYSTKAAKLIAAGSGQLVKGILWCGDVTVDRLIKGNEILKLKIGPASNTAVNPELLKAIHRVNKVTKMTETVVGGLLSGVLKITGFFTSSVASSKLGKKFFKFLPGEIALATLDGFSKICDAFEVSGKNVMSTSSTVTTELVNHRYGEEAAKATNEGLDAAGHAVGAAWTVFKIRTAMNPKGVVAPSVLTKTGLKDATEEMRNKALKDIKAKDSQKTSK